MMLLLQFNDLPVIPAAADVEAWQNWLETTLRLIGASGLGLLVSCLYCYHRPAAERTRGFSQALILLAPLITMVTMAVVQGWNP